MTSFGLKKGEVGNRKMKKVAFVETSRLSSCDYSPAQDLSMDLFTTKDWIGTEFRPSVPSVTKQDYDLELPSSSSVRNHPNILKKRELNLPEPIKTLPFSPSRFLNSVVRSQEIDKDKVTKDLNFSLMQTDDSGFEASGYDADGLFAKALTSTPICKKSQKSLDTPLKAADHLLSPLKPDTHLSETYVSLGPETDTNPIKHNATSRDSGNETVFKTPLIRRFLNESGPRTPTPFKCETIVSVGSVGRTCKAKHTFSMSTSVEDDIFPVSSCDSKSSVFSIPSKMKSRSNPSRPQKKARKALVLDMEMCPTMPEHKANYLRQAGSSQLAVQLPETLPEHLGFVPFDHPLPKNTIRVRTCSGLVGEGTIVKCRKFGVGRKSFCTTHHDSKQDEDKDWKDLSELNRKWVAIACGHSDDQKAMTEAARRYLMENKVKNVTSGLSSVVLKKRFNCRSMMR